MSDCIPIALLLAALTHGRELEARVAELSRPKNPTDYGVTSAPLTPMEAQLVMALLPPGEVLHRDALVARVWPAFAAAGQLAEGAHLLRVNLSRVRTKLGGGWRMPVATGRGEYVLLGPGQALPAGHRPLQRPVAGNGTATHVPCPECDGTMWAGSPRCGACRRRRDAARKRPLDATCPACGGRMDWRGKTCRRCYRTGTRDRRGEAVA